MYNAKVLLVRSHAYESCADIDVHRTFESPNKPAL